MVPPMHESGSSYCAENVKLAQEKPRTSALCSQKLSRRGSNGTARIAKRVWGPTHASDAYLEADTETEGGATCGSAWLQFLAGLAMQWFLGLGSWLRDALPWKEAVVPMKRGKGKMAKLTGTR